MACGLFAMDCNGFVPVTMMPLLVIMMPLPRFSGLLLVAAVRLGDEFALDKMLVR